MSWQSYVDSLMADGTCQDAAIVGFIKTKYVWASHSGGTFSNITSQEIDSLIDKDKASVFTAGLTLGSKKCSIIRDNLQDDGEWTMDIRTKTHGEETTTYNISVAKASTVLVLVMGKEGTHGGLLNKKAFQMAKYLRDSGF
ncbi:unnamed protein product [Knipowitschia caucasica]|uniref:Profilin n=1 Tax=Knipowitschia caucasica TaxID=637954 RepID=A0AAV2JQV5_KNICA